MEREKALEAARIVHRALKPVCEKVVLAGSLRRGKEEVKDVEIVALPCYAETLMREPEFSDANVTAVIEELRRAGWLEYDPVVKRNGPRYKRLKFKDALYGPLVVDLFLADKDNFGAILAIRTGDADFSRLLVTPRRQNGLMPAPLRMQDGYLVRRDTIGGSLTDRRLPCYTEEAFFAHLGLEVPAPETRTEERIAVLRQQSEGGETGERERVRG